MRSQVKILAAVVAGAFGIGSGLAAAQAQAPAPRAVPPDSATPPLDARPPSPYPAGLSLPWRLVGIDPAEAARARTALNASEAALAAAWLTQPQTLTAYAEAQRPGERVPLNTRRLTDAMRAGTPKAASAAPAVALEPTWCSFFDRHVLAVAVVDARLGTLLASAHTSIPRADWRTAAETKALEAVVTTRATALATEALAAAAARGAQPPTDALHLALDLGRAATRADEGYGLCLAQLLEERLAPELTVARAGGEALATLRRVLGAPPELRRPTRRVVLRWHRSPDERRAPRTLPAELRLDATLAESVFGHHVPTPDLAAAAATPWRFAADARGRIGFELAPSLRALLDAERATLRLADWPQVARVDRAWVYLDRGRAWGLKMSDRLVAEVDGEPVKGHVVRFFGPEAGLTSPRGHPIREGAILYVRKGQRLTRVGTEFRMDPRTFPWTPPPGSDRPKGTVP